MHRIKEKARLIEVKNSYDVVVIGGGVAGVSASIAAARNKTRVCLIERYCATGGLATAGNVNIYLPLCDGNGHQVITGLAEELMKISISDGYGKIPDCWIDERNIEQRKRIRLQVEFNPWNLALELEKILVKEGAEIMYDTRFCSVIKNKNRITHIIVENKTGRFAIECRAVVDATGDADVCAAAGETVERASNNVACGWFFYFDGKNLQKRAFSQKYDPYNKATYDSAKGFSVEDTTDQILASREHIRALLEKMRKEKPSIYPVSLPSIPTFRMTGRIKGKIELEESHERIMFPDTVGMAGDWRKPGPVYYLPFSALYGVKTSNLITAGRCISANTAWDIIRAIPVCSLTGEIAGTASALLCRRKMESFSSINIKKLQQALKAQGIKIDEKV